MPLVSTLARMSIVYFPDPFEDIRNPLNNERSQTHACRGPITYPKIKINQEHAYKWRVKLNKFRERKKDTS